MLCASSSLRTLSVEESKTRRSFTGVNPDQICYLDQEALTEKCNGFNLSSKKWHEAACLTKQTSHLPALAVSRTRAVAEPGICCGKLWDPLQLLVKIYLSFEENTFKNHHLKIWALDPSFATVNSQKDSCQPAFLCYRTNCSREGMWVDVAHCHLTVDAGQKASAEMSRSC